MGRGLGGAALVEVSGEVAFEQRPESLEELAVQLSGEEGTAVQRP